MTWIISSKIPCNLSKTEGFSNRRIWAVILVIYFLIVTFPGGYCYTEPGLDPSWVYALNSLCYVGHVWGRDVAFTYGPLGYLLHPLDIGLNLAQAMALRIILQVLIGVVLFWIIFSQNNRLKIWSLGAFILANVIAIACGLCYEYNLLIVLALLLLVPPQNRKLWFGAVSLSGFLSGAFLFMKFSLGLAGLAMLAVAIIIWTVQKREKAWTAFLLASCTYLLAVVLFAIIFMGSSGSFVRWIKASLEITSGYSVAMSIPGPKEILVLGLLAGAAYVILLLLYWKVNSKLFQVGMVFSGPLFLAFKHGFVRQDGHVILFFTFIIAVMGVLLLFSTSPGDLRISSIAFLAILVFSLPAVTVMRSDPALKAELMSSCLKADIESVVAAGVRATYCSFLQPFWRVSTGAEGLANIGSALNLGDLRSMLRKESRLALQRDILPHAWVVEIKKHTGTVDVLPWEIAYCPANDLNWSPNPLLQTYSAYTSFLDKWSAGHYTGEKAPEFLIVEFIDIDGRHLMLDVPATWQAILRNYRLVRKDLDSGLLLLEKKPLPTPDDGLKILGQERIGANQWIVVPPSDKLLFAKIDLKLRFIGKITKTLFRIDPVYIDLLYDSGKGASFRIVPDTAKNGLLINYLPTNHYELANLLNGIADDRVAKFRISGPGSLYLDKDIHLKWLESPSASVKFGPKQIDPQKLTLTWLPKSSVD